MAEVPYISTALLASVSIPNGVCAGRRPRPEVACARWGLIALTVVIALGYLLNVRAANRHVRQ